MQVKEDVVRHDLGRVLLKLEEMQDEQITKALDPKPAAVAINDEDRAAALELLRDPRSDAAAFCATSNCAAWWAKRPTS